MTFQQGLSESCVMTWHIGYPASHMGLSASRMGLSASRMGLSASRMGLSASRMMLIRHVSSFNHGSLSSELAK
jgi:hypothetical protein